MNPTELYDTIYNPDRTMSYIKFTTTPTKNLRLFNLLYDHNVDNIHSILPNQKLIDDLTQFSEQYPNRAILIEKTSYTYNLYE